jgi:hypothetical protein
MLRSLRIRRLPHRSVTVPPEEAMSEIEVRVVSPEEAEHGTAEFWLGGKLFGFTRLQDGELVLTIEPGDDGLAVSVNAHDLHDALAEAKRLLGAF